jgi:multiple sugar transport system substrate-binding protein
MKKLLLPFAIALAASVNPAAAKVTITCLTNAGHLTRQHEPLMKKFNEMQDKIEVQYAAPAKDYADTHLRLFRESATNTLPDCAFQAYNQLPSLVRALQARNQIVDLGPLLEKEGADWVRANYTDQMLALGQVDGVQVGMPFNASVVQWYYNADLLKKVGHDPDKFPTDWDGVFELAAKINALGDDIHGMSYAVEQWGDDWPWQILITQQGGGLLDKSQTKVTFDQNGYSLKAMELVKRVVDEGKYDPAMTASDQMKSFTSGTLGIYANSPASARNIAELVGDKFDLRSVKFTIVDDANGTLPTGGNAMLITATDPEKIAAAWEYAKFMSGPEAQAITARNTGYLPTNVGALGEAHLAPYYRENPYYATPSTGYDRAGLWQGYPGTQSEKIWREQKNILRSVMLGETTPGEGADQMKKVAEELMQR